MLKKAASYVFRRGVEEVGEGEGTEGDGVMDEESMLNREESEPRGWGVTKSEAAGTPIQTCLKAYRTLKK